MCLALRRFFFAGSAPKRQGTLVRTGAIAQPHFGASPFGPEDDHQSPRIAHNCMRSGASARPPPPQVFPCSRRITGRKSRWPVAQRVGDDHGTTHGKPDMLSERTRSSWRSESTGSQNWRTTKPLANTYQTNDVFQRCDLLWAPPSMLPARPPAPRPPGPSSAAVFKKEGEPQEASTRPEESALASRVSGTRSYRSRMIWHYYIP